MIYTTINICKWNFQSLINNRTFKITVSEFVYPLVGFFIKLEHTYSGHRWRTFLSHLSLVFALSNACRLTSVSLNPKPMNCTSVTYLTICLFFRGQIKSHSLVQNCYFLSWKWYQYISLKSLGVHSCIPSTPVYNVHQSCKICWRTALALISE
jgi:hypothetical protein